MMMTSPVEHVRTMASSRSDTTISHLYHTCAFFMVVVPICKSNQFRQSRDQAATIISPSQHEQDANVQKRQYKHEEAC